MKKVRPSLDLTAKKDFGAGTGCNNFNLGIDEARDILTHFRHEFVAGTQVFTGSDRSLHSQSKVGDKRSSFRHRWAC